MSELVSVIIPTYNRADVITRCVNSVLNQTYKNIEIIIIDDGSIDNTREVILQYNKNIQYHYQHNSGVSKARNIGASYAKGKYLAFIDSDDEWNSMKIELQVDEFLCSKDIALVYCESQYISLDGVAKSTNADKLELNQTYTFLDVFKNPYFGMPNVVVLKKAFDRVNGFDTSLQTAEDIDLFLRISIDSSVRKINKSLTYVYESRDSLSAGLNSYKDNIKVFNNLISCNPKLFDDNLELVNTVMANLFLEYSRTLIWYGDYYESISKLFKSLSYKFNFECLMLIAKASLLMIFKR